VQVQKTQDHEREQQQETKEQETQDQGQHQDQEQQKPMTPDVLRKKALNVRMTNRRFKIAEYQMVLKTRAANLEHRQNQVLQRERPVGNAILEAQEEQELLQELQELQNLEDDLNEMKVKNNEDDVLSRKLT
jgi:hypothetical protein